ncbi:MAG: CsgG/HfaB family protein, partial [Calditrichales bacterium]|nr:CsgG/HfaB family protein [Calditrichales bacterium]
MKIYLLFAVILHFLFIANCTSQRPLIAHKAKEAQNSLDVQLENLTDQIVVSLSQTQKSKIAVIEFSNLQGTVTKFGRYLAEELITRLYLSNKFEVIERQLLNKVLQEHQLNLSGLIDVSSAQELGRLLGVDAIASGSVTDLGKMVKVNARLISTETGKIFSVASVTVTKDDVVNNLMGASNAPVKNMDEPIQEVPGDPQNTPLNMIVKQNEFTFELKSCKMENRKVTCSFIIINDSDNDINLSMVIPATKLFDEWGNEHSAMTLKLANSTSKKGWYRLKKLIIPGVPTAAELIFENVSSTATRISLLNLLVESG